MQLDRRRRMPTLSWLVWALIGFECVWVLSLPLFPSQDGPWHLYNAHVFASLLAGSPVYAPYYAIAHYLPPYALQDYLLISLMKFVSPAMAEELVVCLIFLLLMSGFRAMAVQMGSGWQLMSLLSLPLLYSWPVGAGFHNYCLSLGLAMWGIGCWLKAAATRRAKYLTGYLLFAILCTVTHPIPLGILLAFAFLELIFRFVAPLETKDAHFARMRRWSAGIWLASAALALYVRGFRGRPGRFPVDSEHQSVLEGLKHFATLRYISPFSGQAPLALLYRLGFYVILIAALYWMIQAFRSASRSEMGPVRTRFLVTFASATLLLACALPFLPHVLFVGERLQLMVWFGALAGASAFSSCSRKATGWIAGMAVLAWVGTMVVANRVDRPIARELAEINAEPVPLHPGEMGIAVAAPGYKTPSVLSYGVTLWDPARYFERANAVMYNPPFGSEPYMPIAARPGVLTDPVPLGNIGVFAEALRESPELRRQTMQRIDFLIEVSKPGPARNDQLAMLFAADPDRRWTCTDQQWFSLCKPVGGS